MKAEEINELMTANLISQAMEVIYILSAFILLALVKEIYQMQMKHRSVIPNNVVI